MLEYRHVRIHQWPGKFTAYHWRKDTVFKDKKNKPMPLSDTFAILETEMRFLNGKNVILQTAHTGARDFRQDGRLRADARRPEHPGVILTFDSKHGALSYPCDHFHDWESNLRAVAFHLQNVRHSQLYGVGAHGEAYKGFAALPAPAPPTDRETAIRTILKAAGRDVTPGICLTISEPSLRAAIVEAIQQCTGADGGDSELLARVQAARDVLRGVG